MNDLRSASGYSLIELVVATGLLLMISGVATGGLMQMTKHQQTVWNRTEMHSGISGATELLQQEVGQAGRMTLPSTTITLTTPVTVPPGTFPCTQTTTGQIDPVTHAYQTETKALLNVSPRNVFNTWVMAGYGAVTRVQPTPPTIAGLLP